MKNKIKIFFAVLLVSYTNIYSQFKYDSIKVCHNEDKKLNWVSVGDYSIQFQNGKLLSFSTKDGLNNYDEGKRAFTIRNLGDDYFFRIQLQDDGVLVQTKDKSFLVNTPESVDLEPDSSIIIGTSWLIREVTVFFKFKFNRIDNIYFRANNKNFKILLKRPGNILSWDYIIDDDDDRNTLLMMVKYDQPWLFSICDDDNNTGIRFSSKKGNGVFNTVEGLRIYGTDKVFGDRDFQLRYGKNGKLRKGTSKFTLSCQE